MRCAPRSLRALVVALLVGATFPGSAIAAKRCYNFGTDWRRSPYYQANATQSGEKAAAGQVLRSADYVASAASGGGYADEAFTKMKTSDTQVVSIITHGSGTDMVLIDKPSRSNMLSCINVSNRGSHSHFGIACDHQRPVRDFGGVSSGARLVVFQGCETAKLGAAGYTYGLTTATYHNLLPTDAVLGFKSGLSWYLDADRNDVASRRWSYIFWDYMGRGYDITYAASRAKESVSQYFGSTLGYESFAVAGDKYYALPQ